MKQGDHVKIMGRDGFYEFETEAQGMAILRLCDKNSADNPRVSIPIHQVLSLETTELLLGFATDR
jgi:hypothetical protein